MKALRSPSVPQQTTDRMDRMLFERAQRYSQLAKVLGGKSRARLYELKNAALRQLLQKGSEQNIAVGVDRDLYPGLIVVSVRGCGALHTHEGWLGVTDMRELRASALTPPTFKGNRTFRGQRDGVGRGRHTSRRGGTRG